MRIRARSVQTTVGDTERNRERDLPRRSAKHDAAAAASVVFVVDDDASLRDSMRRLITSVGYKVEVFPSARAFLDARRLDAPGCLVLDVRLPGLRARR
jgi:PleD family two-component response regulator